MSPVETLGRQVVSFKFKFECVVAVIAHAEMKEREWFESHRRVQVSS